MKKNFLSFFLISISFTAFSQTPVVQTGFDNYAGTSASAPAGWYMSWHSTSSPSYYTSAGNFGASAPSYKLGQDSVFVISPKYSGADTLAFWCKGNGVPFGDTNELHIYYSTDSFSWLMFENRDSLPVAGTTLKYGLPVDTGWVMFVYRKFGTGNLAFDDVNLLAYTPISVAENDLSELIAVFPSVSSGMITIHHSPFTIHQVEIFDAVGNKIQNFSGMQLFQSVFSFDLSDEQNGIYFVRIETEIETVTKKIILFR